MKRSLEERRGQPGKVSRWLLAPVACVLLLLTPILTHASTLRSLQASAPSSDKTILSLRFDSPDPVRLTTSRGRILELQGCSLPPEGVNVRSRGLFAAVRPTATGIEIVGTRYLSGRLTPAGAGVFLLFLEPAVEPKPATPAPTPAATTQKPAEKPLNSSRTGENGQPARSTPESEAVTPRNESVSGQQATAGMQLGMRPTGMPVVPSILPEVVQIGVQIAEQGDVDRALTYLATIQPSESGYGWSRVVMGELIEQQGDLSRALDVYREALVDPSTESVASVHLALAFQDLVLFQTADLVRGP